MSFNLYFFYAIITFLRFVVDFWQWVSFATWKVAKFTTWKSDK